MPELYSFVFLKESEVGWDKTLATSFLSEQKIPFQQVMEDDRLLCFIVQMGDADKEYTLAGIGQDVFIVIDKVEVDEKKEDEGKEEDVAEGKEEDVAEGKDAEKKE